MNGSKRARTTALASSVAGGRKNVCQIPTVRPSKFWLCTMRRLSLKKASSKNGESDR